MRQEAWHTYLELVFGLADRPRKRAMRVIDALISRGSGADADQFRSMAEELVEIGRSNRKNVTKLVRGEWDRALGAVGLAYARDVTALRNRVSDLEQRLQAVENGASRSATPHGTPQSATKAPATKAAAGKTPARKTVARKAATGTGKRAAATGRRASGRMREQTAPRVPRSASSGEEER